MPKKQSVRDSLVQWVVFTDNCAVLRRMVRSNGAKGLLLQFTQRGRHEDVRRRAVAAGFHEFGDTGELYIMAPKRPSKFDAGAMASLLGGVVYAMPKAKLLSYPWTIDYSKPDWGKSTRFQDALTSGKPRYIGRNFRDEPVYRASDGSRSRKAVADEGKAQFVPEPEDGGGPEFLRLRQPEEIPAIAAGLLCMAGHGSVGEQEFQQVIKAVAEPMRKGSKPYSAANTAQLVRDAMLRQIIDVTIEDNGSRQSYHKAMRLADNALAVLDQGEADDAGFSPSPGLLIFLRRLHMQAAEVEITGSSRLELAVPATGSASGSPHQLFDLTDDKSGRVHERIFNILAQRNSDGVSTLIVSGPANCAEVENVRASAGLSYAIETVAEICSPVAIGRQGRPPFTMFVIGERRPGPSDGLPQAALRTFSVFSRDDLDRLHTEILRSRRKIRQWHQDLDRAAGRPDEEREDNERQRPYLALSRATRPFTMIPKSLEGATARALQRVAGDFEPEGGVDRAVAASLGTEPEALHHLLTAEQVDSIAMRSSAHRRNRGFLLADQTGIGKGRSLAAMARQHIRQDGKVLYLTENAEINISDVWRDLDAVGGLAELRPVILAGKPVKLATIASSGVPLGKTTRPTHYSTLGAAKRREVFESGEWPAGCNIVLTNYSLFNRGESSPAWRWATTAPDEHTLLILDESHNATNRSSNTGKAVRRMIELVGRQNVVFATATPMRNPSGADLYKPLLPDAEGGRLDRILANLAPGGETAQESFTTMLGEDGTYLRRDHDLSNLEFEYRLPDDERIRNYQQTMNRMTPVVELMIDIWLRVGALIGRVQSQRYQRMIDEGIDERTARTQCNALYQYSGAIGSPLARLARLTINAIKVDQVVEETINELKEGRKPLITFHSTGASLFNELATEGGFEGNVPLTLSDQIRRVAESIFRVRIEDQTEDARTRDREIRDMSERLDELITQLPAHLPASPVDDLIGRLMEQGYTAGEISGRAIAYRNQRIVRRKPTDRKSTVDAFNQGALDVLIYNSAGATGGSYHAAPEFGDRRPRTLIEMETPVDIIKYIQSQGRGNRYGQVAKPRIVSVMTGLIPEMRILQQRNRKLRALGASVDGNRSHPLLMDDVPDLLNKVGDQATAQILRTNPDLTRRLGFTEFLSDETSDETSDEERALDWMNPDSGASKSIVDSIANKALTRSLVLSATNQERLVQLITIEYEAIIEELESRNQNPLRPKEIPGEVEFHATSLYSGVETEEGDLETSSFFAPLYMSTGTHHMNDDPITGDQLMQMVERSMISDGMDGFASHAAQVESMLPTLLAHLTPPGMSIAQALATTGRYQVLKKRHSTLARFIDLLGQIRPGVALRFDGDEGGIQGLLRTVVKLSKPRDEHVHLPQAYRVQTVCPGDGRTEIYTLRRLLPLWPGRLQVLPGLSMGMNKKHLKEFANQLRIGRRYPVQVLTGNLLQAITEAQSHRLGTMCLFRELDGKMQRGVVVNKSKVDLDRLPVILPSRRVLAGLICRKLSDELRHSLTVWNGKRRNPDFSIRVTRHRFPEDTITRFMLWAKRGLIKSKPELKPIFDDYRSANLRWPDQIREVEQVLDAIDGLDLMVDGVHRAVVNEVTRIVEVQDELPAELDLTRLAEA